VGNIVIIIHPTCATSYKIIKYLKAKGILDKVEVLNSDSPATTFKYNVWSVPWILLDGEPVATDPIEPEELYSIINAIKINMNWNPTDKFMETILHSAYASSITLLHDSIKPVMDEDLIKAALRTRITRLTREEIKVTRELYISWKDKLARALAISFIRELWWATQGNPPETLTKRELDTLIPIWLISKASIGRAGLPNNPAKTLHTTKPIIDFIQKTYKNLLKKIQREQETIYTDKEYWKTLNELGINQ